MPSRTNSGRTNGPTTPAPRPTPGNVPKSTAPATPAIHRDGGPADACGPSLGSPRRDTDALRDPAREGRLRRGAGPERPFVAGARPALGARSLEAPWFR